MSEDLLTREARVKTIASLIEAADVIRIDDTQNVTSWEGPEEYTGEDDNLLFYFSWISDDAHACSFKLNEEALATATFEGNRLTTYEADSGETVTLDLFTMTALPVNLDAPLREARWQRYAAKWNADLNVGQLETLMKESKSPLAADGTSMWFHIMKQEIEMWLRIGLTVTDADIDVLARRRGAGRAERQYWQEMLKEIQLYGEDQVHDSTAARAEA